MNPSYWARHLRQTVRFCDCVQELLNEPNRVFLEVGPGNTFSTLVRLHPNKTKDHIVLSSIRHPKEEKSDVAFILNTLGRLWLAGVQVDWSGFYKDEHRHRVPLPTYPFERRRYWMESVGQPQGLFASQAGLTEIGDSSKGPTTDTSQSEYMTPRNPELTDDYVAPRTEVERTIAAIWQQLLGIERVGMNDNFFELGGHSMLGGQIISRLRDVFRLEVPIDYLFENPTIARLAESIETLCWVRQRNKDFSNLSESNLEEGEL
jgi:acyl carrier protein